MASMNVSIPDPIHAWVQQRIEDGNFASPSDYIRDLIRRDQLHANAHQSLVAALIEGEQSGPSPRQIPDILAALKAEQPPPAE